MQKKVSKKISAIWPLKEKKSQKEVEFSWTDRELQYLLQSALKEKCEFNAEDWEMKRQKYEDIFDILIKEYPGKIEKY